MKPVIKICYLAIILILISCSEDKNNKRVTIAFSQCIGNDAWRKTMLEEMKRELSFYSNVRFLYKDANGDNEVQINQIRELAKSDIDILIVSPNEASPLTPIVDSLFQKNIPVIVTDRKTSSGMYNAYVGADNQEIGEIAGDYIASIIKHKGNIGIITGLEGSSASIEREKGLNIALKKYPQINLKTRISGNWEKQNAKELVLSNLEEINTLDVLLAFNDQMAMGANESISNNKIIIIGVDALPGKNNGLEQISNGKMNASILYPTGGTESIRTAISIINKLPYNRDNILGTLVIDKTNAKLLEMQYNKIKDQQNDIDKRQQLIIEQTKIYQNQKSILNILISSLVITVVLAAVSILALKSNWEKNKFLEIKNNEILTQKNKILEMNEKLKETSELKNNFFTKISHEFKTPLTLIIAPIEELNKINTFPIEVKSQLERMGRSANKLLSLIGDLLDLNKITSNRIKLNAEYISLDVFIKQILNNFKPLFNKKKIYTSYQRLTKINSIWIDEYLMEQAISNIISNAVKFTPEGGKIQIIIEENELGDYIHLRIKDNGIGINKKFLHNLFEPYFQVNASSTGSGIGLAYVKEIIELHYGQITASSKEGLGTTITLRLLIGDNHLNVEDKARNKQLTQQFENKKLSDTLDEKYFTPIPVINSNSNKFLLIIDDNDEIQAYLKEIFQNEYNLLFALNYNDAKKVLNENYPDLIICDVMLPDGNGLDLLTEIKENPSTFQVPIILLSAVNNQETKVEAYKRFVDVYITKPFNADYLIEIVKSLLISREQLKEKFSCTNNSIEPGNSMTSIDKKFLTTFQSIVDSNMSNPKLGANYIASEMNISRIQLYRKIKQLLNLSIQNYIIEKRLMYSKKLILEGYNINEIYEKLGFSSATYFTVAFKKRFNLSPSTYKKQSFQ